MKSTPQGKTRISIPLTEPADCMKIVILTENSPLYIPAILAELFMRLRQNNHRIAAVFYFSPYGRAGLMRTIKDRLSYYGIRDFMKASARVLWQKFLILPAVFWPGLGAYSVLQAARQNRVDCRPATSPNSPEFIDWLESQQVDLLVSVACPKILKAGVLSVPSRGCLNYHPSLLPSYRGLQPLFWALLNREKTVGVSVHKMDEGIDTGAILVQEEIPVAPGDSLHDLYQKTARLAPRAIATAVEMAGIDPGGGKSRSIAEGDYFSFPTRDDSLRFRRAGMRFF